jgi:hypothetical protein
MSAKLKLVAEATEDEAFANLMRARAKASAAKGKHIVDLLRSEIGKRNWAACHIRGDRAPSVVLPDRPGGRWLR